MPQGNYTVTYTLKTSNNKLNETIILDAFYNKTIINSIEIRETMLKNNTWTPIGLNITLNTIAYDMELRGILLGVNTTIALDTIRLEERP